MTSDSQVRANRANADHSTGPKSKSGKSAAARNSRGHGLSIPISCDPRLAADVENAALEIAGVDATPLRRRRARPIAEAQIDLLRIRQARHSLMESVFDGTAPKYMTKAASMRYVRLMIRIDKHVEDGFLVSPQLRDLLDLAGKPERFTLFTPDMARSLAAIDRYERRAISRRKRAIREFDTASLVEAESADRAKASAKVD
jgi:hypothetical protein